MVSIILAIALDYLFMVCNVVFPIVFLDLFLMSSAVLLSVLSIIFFDLFAMVNIILAKIIRVVDVVLCTAFFYLFVMLGAVLAHVFFLALLTLKISPICGGGISMKLFQRLHLFTLRASLGLHRKSPFTGTALGYHTLGLTSPVFDRAVPVKRLFF